MLIHRIWKTQRLEAHVVTETRFVEGWFLFGVIPLYIRTLKLEA
jgi:hypothetical protein